MRTFATYLRRHHVALLALFVALGGTSYAAARLPANSVGSKQLQNRAVTYKKIAPATRKRLRGLRGHAGPTGSQGPAGLATALAGGDLVGAFPDPKLRAGSVGATERAATPQVQVLNSASQQGTGVAIQPNVNNFAAFDQALLDTGAMWSAADPTRATVRTAGTYLLGGEVAWNEAPAPTGNARQLCVMVYDLGGTPDDGLCTHIAPNANFVQTQTLSFVRKLVPGQALRLDLIQNGATATHAFDLRLTAAWLGPA
jgi:hypothetical protein